MNTELVFALICGALLGAGALAEQLGLIDRMSLVLYVSAYVFGGWFTTKEAISNIRQKRFEIDTLMLLAAAGAASIGAWAEGALLLFLFSLGHSLESYAMGRAKKAIEALSKLAPTTAMVRSTDGTNELPVELLVPGDVVIVRPYDRLAGRVEQCLAIFSGHNSLGLLSRPRGSSLTWTRRHHAKISDVQVSATSAPVILSANDTSSIVWTSYQR